MTLPEPNPYSAPRSEVDPRVSDEHSVDLYMQTLPSPGVRSAGVASMLAGGGMVLSTLQVLGGARNVVGFTFAGVLGLLAIAYLVVAWGVANARMWTVITGFVIIPFAGLASLLYAFSVSFLGFVDGLLCMVHAALLLTALGDLRRMAHARSLLARAGQLET